MKKFDIPPRAIQLGLDLAAYGKSESMKSHYRKHPSLPGANMIYARVSPPKNGKPGQVYLYRCDEKNFTVGHLTPETQSYDLKMYQGNRIYIHPEHSRCAKESREDRYQGGDLDVGLLIIKGRGAVTFYATP